MQIAIFIACCFIIGMLIVVCLELRKIHKNIKYCIYHNETLIEWYCEKILDEIPNTFEYNSMRGKVFKK